MVKDKIKALMEIMLALAEQKTLLYKTERGDWEKLDLENRERWILAEPNKPDTNQST